MPSFSYVYIVESLSVSDRFYAGLTDNLTRRLAAHNRGVVSHTTKFRPWRVKTAIAFRDRKQAAVFELYLKSPSGRAIAKKRL